MIPLLFGFGLITCAEASDVSPNFFILKEQRFYQDSTAAPVLSTTNTQGAPYRVSGFVEATSSGSIISASIVSGSSAAISLVNANDGVGDFKGSSQFEDPASLSAAYSGTSYALSGTGASGPFYSGSMTISGTFSQYTPTITNNSWVDGDLQISSTSAFTLTWAPLGDATSSDILFLQIVNQSTGLLTDDMLLSGTSVSETIPAMAPGYYTGSLFYGLITGTSTAIAGATGYSGYSNDDRFVIDSIPEPAPWAEVVLSMGGLIFLARRRHDKSKD